ncbi:hypothetical protein QO003_001854 [Arthrobacter silviterrae]|uniref:Uncharacterized protein n=1 Tax=Arthrobacter silviterrae TaxID=2026658 RepID=A0ABX0DIH1_9MICC|nr:hypothetical protein [Arthrobacter silviterrae]MDQ0277551.1 hypothetical protein [Arthrobacter silviterrae]NGN85225.1 hypothetical protein [Arthrobacter silviterrae]
MLAPPAAGGKGAAGLDAARGCANSETRPSGVVHFGEMLALALTEC